MSLFNRYCERASMSKNLEYLVSDYVEKLPREALSEAEDIFISTLKVIFAKRRMREGNLERRKEIGH